MPQTAPLVPALLAGLAVGCLAASGCRAAPAPPASDPPAEGAPARGGDALPASALEEVQGLFDRIAEITGDDSLSPSAKRAQVAYLVTPLLDPATLSRAALGDLAERFSREEYSAFAHEYQRFVTASLMRRFAAHPGKAIQLEDGQYDAERERVVLRARGLSSSTSLPGVRRYTRHEASRLELSFQRKRGEWRLVGMKRGELDAASSLRDQFASVLSREDPGALIANLRQRNRAAEEDNPFAGRR